MSTTPTQPFNSRPNAGRTIATSTQGSTLADILERVLDKGVVIAGDISVSVASTELLHIRIRLLISSVDKAREMGINWWEGDPYLSSNAKTLTEENRLLQERLHSRPLAKKIYVIIRGFKFNPLKPTHNCKLLTTDYNADHNGDGDFDND